MPRFTMPRDVHYGRESIERLSELRGKRAMLVAASEEKKEGAFARAETALRRTGMEVRLLESPWPEYTEQAVAEGASAMRAFAPDWIVAFGSMAIDAAKLMWILYEYPEAALSDLHLRSACPISGERHALLPYHRSAAYRKQRRLRSFAERRSKMHGQPRIMASCRTSLSSIRY